MEKIKMYIDGNFTEAEDGGSFIVKSPGDGGEIAEVPSASEKDVNKAVEAAGKAFECGKWSGLDGDERAEYMLKAAAIMKKRFRELARWEALDTGKPVSETEAVDIPYSIRAMEYFVNLSREIQGNVIPIPKENVFDWVSYEPYGVVGAITPWNFPLHLATRAICPALATGNTVVAKASSLAPVTSLLLGEIFHEAGLPEGVVNIISGSGSIAGEAVINHPDVAMITFTGSLKVGRRILKASAESAVIKKTLLELGGKGPYIVEPDCNLDDSVNQLIKGFCLNQGEVCCASTRLFLNEQIYDKFMKLLVSRVNQLKIGNNMDPSTQVGALIDEENLIKIDGQIKNAVAEGAVLLTGGERYTEPPCDKGAYYRPTILADCNNRMSCAREEFFGPVLFVMRYKDFDEAIREANDNQYGLGASVFTQDYKKLFYASGKLDAGTIWLNSNVMSKIEAPYGGNKNSGLGREYGTIGLKEYLKVKNNILNLSDSVDDFYHFKK